MTRSPVEFSPVTSPSGARAELPKEVRNALSLDEQREIEAQNRQDEIWIPTSLDPWTVSATALMFVPPVLAWLFRRIQATKRGEDLFEASSCA